MVILRVDYFSDPQNTKKILKTEEDMAGIKEKAGIECLKVLRA
jgi:hypothetical protein